MSAEEQRILETPKRLFLFLKESCVFFNFPKLPGYAGEYIKVQIPYTAHPDKLSFPIFVGLFSKINGSYRLFATWNDPTEGRVLQRIFSVISKRSKKGCVSRIKYYIDSEFYEEETSLAGNKSLLALLDRFLM